MKYEMKISNTEYEMKKLECEIKTLECEIKKNILASGFQVVKNHLTCLAPDKSVI